MSAVAGLSGCTVTGVVCSGKGRGGGPVLRGPFAGGAAEVGWRAALAAAAGAGGVGGSGRAGSGDSRKTTISESGTSLSAVMVPLTEEAGWVAGAANDAEAMAKRKSNGLKSARILRSIGRMESG